MLALPLRSAGLVLQHAHSVLEPGNVQAARIQDHLEYFLVVSAIVFALVMGAAIWAAVRRRPQTEDTRSARREAAAGRAVIGALGATVLVLFGTLVYDLRLGRALTHVPPRDALEVTVTGRQWWWEVVYEDPVPANRLTSANELHLPVGQRVMLRLQSADVIHSLWIPALGVKKDLIPGHFNAVWVEATRPGVFRGQCAEFCGLQHARMGLYVVAHERPAFKRWLQQQRAPAPAPRDSLAHRGRAVFEGGACALCHAVRGTAAAGRVGPDLTHVASRLSLAAGTLPNTRGHLAGWILEPQATKPGVIMPPSALHARDLQALLAWLETLR